MSKLDNMFAKVISDPAICKEYNITNPEQYDNIAVGMKSSNGYVSAVATALREICMTMEIKKAEMKKTGSTILDDNEMKTIYRKVLTILEKTR